MASWWSMLKRIMTSEASDAKEEFDKLRQALDRELTRKERELEASPSERVEMILEEIDAGDGRLDEIAQELESREPGEPGDEGEPAAARPAPRARLLVPSDVSTAPHLSAALEMVTVDDPAPDDASPFDHQVFLAPEIESLIGSERLHSVPGRVREHPLVLEAMSDTGTVVFVNAPGLHHDDVRLIAAAAFADHLPDDGKEQLGG